jgi:hypothetical protein
MNHPGEASTSIWRATVAGLDEKVAAGEAELLRLAGSKDGEALTWFKPAAAEPVERKPPAWLRPQPAPPARS